MWPFSPRKTRRPAASRPPRSFTRPRLEALEGRYLLSAGALDPTFGSGGLVTTVPGAGGRANAMAIQSDGDVVVAGWAKDPKTGYQDFMVARYNLDGTLDATFGNGGIVLTPIGKLNSLAEALVLQPDGKIVVGGFSDYTVKTTIKDQAALVRYNADGTLDTAFGSSRTAGIALTTAIPPIACLALETNGEIVAASNTSVGLFTSRGSLDTTFGQSGVVGLNFYLVKALAVQPADGKIIAAGAAKASDGSQLERLSRLNTNGSLDSAFGAGGYVSEQFSPRTPLRGATWTQSYATSVLIQPDGRLVTTGFVQEFYPDGSLENGMVLARFNSDGSPDGGFGSGGSVISTAIDGSAGSGDVKPTAALQADGSLVVAGTWDGNGVPNQGGFATSRYTASGQLDTTWGANGVSDVYVSGHPDGCALEPNGTIVVAGSGNVNINGAPCIFVARYLPSQPEIGSFTASPNPVTAGGSVTLTASGLTDGNPNSSVTQVAFYADSNGDGVLEPGTDTLLGYGTRNADGSWSLTFSTAGWASGTYTLFAQAQDNYGVLGDPSSLTLQVA